MTMAIGKRKAITRWIFYTWFVVEFGVLANKNCVETLYDGGSAIENCDKEFWRGFKWGISGQNLRETKSTLWSFDVCDSMFRKKTLYPKLFSIV